jgi:hypothetical protein
MRVKGQNISPHQSRFRPEQGTILSQPDCCLAWMRPDHLQSIPEMWSRQAYVPSGPSEVLHLASFLWKDFVPR